jgi:hypothetical protein
MHHEDERARSTVLGLLAKLAGHWGPGRPDTQHPLGPVRDIVRSAQLSPADVSYLQAEAPSVLVQTEGDEIYVDYSMLTETSNVRQDGQNAEFNIQVLRTWHVILLRSTFWSRYHEAYEQFGGLVEINHHADALWRMVDPLFPAQSQPLVTLDATIRSIVVFRQILATRSELSDLHPLDALARFCIPGYTERLHEYVQRHAGGVSQMLGLTV